MSAFITQIWLNQIVTAEQVQQMSDQLRSMGLTFDEVESKKDSLRWLQPDPDGFYPIDHMIKHTKSAEIRDTLVNHRETYLRDVADYVSYYWHATVHVDHLPPLLRDDEWRRLVMDYDIRISIGYDSFPNLFRWSAIDSMGFVESVVKTIGWLPVSHIWLWADRHDVLVWGYIAKRMMEITGGLLHPLLRFVGSPENFDALRKLSEQGQFPGKAYSITSSNKTGDGQHSFEGGYFADIDFLSAWLKQPNFTLE